MRDDDGKDGRDESCTTGERARANEREREREAEQERGRARMLALWRAAVESVTVAAAREQGARTGDARAADDAGDDEPEAAPTWVFPPRVRAAG